MTCCRQLQWKWQQRYSKSRIVHISYITLQFQSHAMVETFKHKTLSFKFEHSSGRMFWMCIRIQTALLWILYWVVLFKCWYHKNEMFMIHVFGLALQFAFHVGLYCILSLYALINIKSIRKIVAKFVHQRWQTLSCVFFSILRIKLMPSHYIHAKLKQLR